NYAISYASGTLTVTPAPLVITAEDKAKVYGAGLPEFTVRYEGFVNGDGLASLTTPPSFSTTATQASHVGQYLIRPANAESGNYAINYVEGTLLVTPAPL